MLNDTYTLSLANCKTYNSHTRTGCLSSRNLSLSHFSLTDRHVAHRCSERTLLDKIGPQSSNVFKIENTIIFFLRFFPFHFRIIWKFAPSFQHTSLIWIVFVDHICLTIFILTKTDQNNVSLSDPYTFH
mmetsp:Transcript_9717/g.13384  ORF Transcript_9717/g.13384 Transcript_9717/m.13384 type:complete len:129 (+) Transcript_9717:151-537(+)